MSNVSPTNHLACYNEAGQLIVQWLLVGQGVALRQALTRLAICSMLLILLYRISFLAAFLTYSVR